LKQLYVFIEIRRIEKGIEALYFAGRKAFKQLYELGLVQGDRNNGFEKAFNNYKPTIKMPVDSDYQVIFHDK
jgi:hypothetical protein